MIKLRTEEGDRLVARVSRPIDKDAIILHVFRYDMLHRRQWQMVWDGGFPSWERFTSYETLRTSQFLQVVGREVRALKDEREWAQDLIDFLIEEGTVIHWEGYREATYTFHVVGDTA